MRAHKTLFQIYQKWFSNCLVGDVVPTVIEFDVYGLITLKTKVSRGQVCNSDYAGWWKRKRRKRRKRRRRRRRRRSCRRKRREERDE